MDDWKHHQTSRRRPSRRHHLNNHMPYSTSTSTSSSTSTPSTTPIGTTTGAQSGSTSYLTVAAPSAVNGMWTTAAPTLIFNANPSTCVEPPKTGDLPAYMFYCTDDAGRKIVMTLQPEYQITTFEAFLLTRMILATSSHSSTFSPYLFAKKNNLERHFKYSNG